MTAMKELLHFRGTCAAALVAVAAMTFASAAGAAVTRSHVDVPGSPHFSIFSTSEETVAISGTTDGTTGDEVDLRCFSNAGTSSQLVAGGVGVAADGSFAVPAVDLETMQGRVCRLVAVPAGSIPGDLTPFSGPVMATGEAYDGSYGRGPSDDPLYDYYAWPVQQTAAFDYTSASQCGIYDGYLFDSSLTETAQTYYCNDGFRAEPYGFERTALQVDGSNAYMGFSANWFFNSASNMPTVSHSVSQNPLNGDTTIQESDAIATCPDDTFPPTPESCPEFIDTGVRLDREIAQTDDGHLTTITDHFVSVDGKPHSIDDLTENEQSFNDHADELGYRFPGQAGYFEPQSGQTVSFPDSAPGTIYLRVEGAPDGDTETGRGAIVFGDPTGPAMFVGIYPESSVFYFHQTASIPAGGSATKRFAYAQGYGQTEVEALARKAEAAFQPVPTAAPAPATVTPNGTPAAPSIESNKVKILGAKRNRKKGTALLRVMVPGAGKLALGGKKVKTLRHSAKGAGVIKLKVATKPKFAKTLAAKGRLEVALRITFTLAGGSARSVHRALTLVHR
jgi:hypothetical protein